MIGNNKKLSANSSKFLEKKSLYAQLISTMQMRKLLYPKNCISTSDMFAPIYPPIFSPSQKIYGEVLKSGYFSMNISLSFSISRIANSQRLRIPTILQYVAGLFGLEY